MILEGQAYPLKVSDLNHETNTESGVIEGCYAGRSESQKVVYEQYYKKMYAICMRYTGHSDEAKDLLHDGFMKLFDKLQGRPEIRHFESWVRRLFVNHCLDYVRSAYKKYIVYQGDHDLDETEVESDQEAGSSEFRTYTTDQIIQAFGLLRHDYRVILNLFAIENYSHQEIAESLGIREATSRSKVMRARKQLRRILEGMKS